MRYRVANPLSVTAMCHPVGRGLAPAVVTHTKMYRLFPKSTVYRGLLQGGEGVLLARRMRMLCWWSKRLRCFDMVKDAFHPIVTSSFFFAGHPHPSRSAPPSPPWGRHRLPSPLGNRRCIFVTQQRREPRRCALRNAKRKTALSVVFRSLV